MRNLNFTVAGLTFECVLPDSVCHDTFMYSFRPFLNYGSSQNPIFSFFTQDDKPVVDDYEVLETFENDLGDVTVRRKNDTFAFSFVYTDGGEHIMVANHSFTKFCSYIIWTSEFAGTALTSMIRVAFSQSILKYDALSIHSSVVKVGGNGYLFLGKSGTGKSTHTRLWLDNISGSSLLNDDNPILRIVDNKLLVFGSPWSGKTPCYKNDCAVVSSIVRLEQFPYNEFSCLTGVKAWIEVFPSCSVLKYVSELYDCAVNTVNTIISMTLIGHMKCLPDSEAAKMVYTNVIH